MTDHGEQAHGKNKNPPLQGPQVFMACDHRGFPAKAPLGEAIKALGYEPQDLGCFSEQSVDYPDYADQMAQALQETPQAFGLLICGSGQGMAMRANKFPHIRAALCWNEETARLSRSHNNANILCLGARVLDEESMVKILQSFLGESFAGGHHEKRVEKISAPHGKESPTVLPNFVETAG